MNKRNSSWVADNQTNQLRGGIWLQVTDRGPVQGLEECVKALLCLRMSLLQMLLAGFSKLSEDGLQGSPHLLQEFSAHHPIDKKLNTRLLGKTAAPC